MASPFIALYPSDFLADIGHLGNTELGIYWRLLLVYYRDGRPLSLDTDRLRRLAMAFSPEECRALDAVVSEFFTLTTEPDGTRVWRHKRADIELSRAHNAHEKKSAAARATNLKRWGQASLSDSPSVIAERPNSDGEPEPEPEPSLIQHPSDVRAQAVASAPDCPHRQVLELWKSILPEMPQHDPELWAGARATNLKTRWREVAKAKGWTTKEQGLAWFERLFRYVALSSFLTGRASSGDRRPFLIELEWLVKHGNWVKVREGKYHQESEVAHD